MMHFDEVIMDDLDLELFSKEKQQEIISKMSLSKKAETRNLPDYLSIIEICYLLFPIPDMRSQPKDRGLNIEWRTKRSLQANINKGFKETLIDACINDGLSYQGDITGWDYYGVKNNPHPLAKKGQSSQTQAFVDVATIGWDRDKRKRVLNSQPKSYECKSTDCTIHKGEFKRYFKSIGKWTMVNKGLLAGWWIDDTEELNEIGLADARIKVVLEVIKERSIDPMCIPVGYKQKIKAECLSIKNKDLDFIVIGQKPTDSDKEMEYLFNDSGFDRAWSEASSPTKEGREVVICIENKIDYIKKDL